MRSRWKAPFCDYYIFKLLKKHKNSGENASMMKVRSRSSTILVDFVGYVFYVYNGIRYVPVKVTANMVGMKFGEFSPTRKFGGHAGNKKAVKR
ncbi:30S ribosomal protein S19 [Anaplasmataceae bacterium AB001_6]|nr:30S ribosomal protein S19 [Anaplasmataceae bacterium AB001_6]